jgi:ribosomal protein L4
MPNTTKGIRQMAQKKTELTEAQKATVTAREKLEAAKKTNDAKKTKEALEHLHSCVVAENRERFVRVAGSRVRKARTILRALANVASPRSYHYSETDIAKAESVLGDELKRTIAKMRAGLTKGGAGKAEDDFSFG